MKVRTSKWRSFFMSRENQISRRSREMYFRSLSGFVLILLMVFVTAVACAGPQGPAGPAGPAAPVAPLAPLAPAAPCSPLPPPVELVLATRFNSSPPPCTQIMLSFAHTSPILNRIVFPKFGTQLS